MRKEQTACMLSHFSCVQLFATLWTIARQAPLSGFSRQEYWSRLPCPLPRDLPDPETEPTSPMAPALQADSLLLSHQGTVIPHYPFVVVQVAQSCLTLCHPMDCRRPGFPVFH